MWAGGKLEWDVHNPLRVGDQVRMEACLRDVDVKEEGEAAFVWADYKFHNKYGLALKESRCWVYTNGYQKRKKEVSKITQNKSSSHGKIKLVKRKRREFNSLCFTIRGFE